MKPLRPRTLLAGLVLALLFMAAASVSHQEADSATTPVPETRRPANVSSDKPSGALQIDKLARPTPEAEAQDVFAPRSWFVPPPPPPPAPPVEPAPPPPPSAPPLPFTYLGRFQESPQRLVVFLVRNDRIYAVTEGDVIDNTYRVEGITAGQLALTYLPLNIRQTIAVGESS